MFAAMTALSILLVPGAAGAQTDATGASAATGMSKAQRKEARKEARAKKNAELKQLEKNGYNPAAGNEANYPNDIQNAEKKAGTSGGASQ